MDPAFEIIAKTLGIIVAFGVLFLTGVKICLYSKIENRKNLREQYDFAKKFLIELSTEDNKHPLHPYLVERGYQAIAGENNINTRQDEIAYILTLKNPAMRLDDFMSGRQYLAPLSESKNRRINFTKNLESECSRKRQGFWLRVWFDFTLFVVALYVPAFIRMLANPYSMNTFFVFTAIFFVALLCAWANFDSLKKFNDAERFIENQNRRTPFEDYSI